VKAGGSRRQVTPKKPKAEEKEDGSAGSAGSDKETLRCDKVYNSINFPTNIHLTYFLE